MSADRMERMDPISMTIYGANFPSLEDAQEFFRVEDGIPKRLYQETYLQGEFQGRIEIRRFAKKTNRAEELFANFPQGEYIIQSLQERFTSKLKRQVNTAVVIYGFYLGAHYTGRPAAVMREKRGPDYHVFAVEEMLLPGER